MVIKVWNFGLAMTEMMELLQTTVTIYDHTEQIMATDLLDRDEGVIHMLSIDCSGTVLIRNIGEMDKIETVLYKLSL